MSAAEPGAVGARIRTLRQAKGWSQSDLAGPEYSASYLSRIESGDRPATQQVLDDLATRLGTTADHLLNGRDPAATETAELQVRFAELALHTGEPDHAMGKFQEALGHAEQLPPTLHARAQLGLAQATESVGDLDEALGLFLRLGQATPPGAATWIECTLGLIRCYRQVGDLTKSVDAGEQAMTLLRGRSDWPTPDSVRILTSLQAAYQVRGDLHHAMQVATEALALAEELADRRAMASALWNTSLLNAELGAIGDAVTTAERALALLSEADAERDTVRLRIALARLYTLNDQGTDALRLLGQVEDRVTETATTADLAYWRHERSRALLQLHELDEARSEAQAALKLLGPEPRLSTADIYITLGRIAKATRPRDAVDWLRRAAEHLIGVGLDRAAARTWAELGVELDNVNDTDAARDAYRAATACAGLLPRPALSLPLSSTRADR